MTSRQPGPLAILLSLGLGLLAACGSNPYPGEPDGTLHVFLASEVKSLDPAHAQDEVSNICILNLYDQLYEYEYLERPFRLRPSIAEALPEISDDRLTYTIRIREGIRFVQDACWGNEPPREVNAHDFVFCLKRLMDARTKSTGTWIFDGKVAGLDEFRKVSADIPKNPRRDRYTVEDGYPEVEGLRALDDRTLQIKLTEPYPQFIWTLAMGYTSIYPREAIRYYGKEFLHHAVGTGPYMLESASLSKKFVYVRNPDFREERFPEPRTDTEAFRKQAELDRKANRLADVGKLLPLNDRVVVTVFKETQPQWLYFMRGYLDRTGIPKDNFDGAVDKHTFELLPVMQERGIQLDKDPKMEVIYDCFNMEDPVVGAPAGAKGLAIRRAISLAADNEWAITHLYNGRAERVDGPILREFKEYDPAFLNPWKKRPDQKREEALALARKILADAGYPGGEGIPTLTKDIIDSDINRTFFLAFQRDLADVGIKVEAYSTTWPEFLRRLNNKKSQIWGVSWGADYPDPQNFFQLYYGPNKAPGVNKSCYDNPEFNELYAKARVMLEGEERTALYRRMQEIVTDDCVWSFRYRRRNFNLRHPWLFGYRYNDMGQKYFKYCRVDSEMRAREVERVNKPTVWPLYVFFGFLGVAVTATLISARRRVRGW